MNYATLSLINASLFFLDILLLLFLAGLIAYSFVRKNLDLLKISILYLLNQIILTIISLTFLTYVGIITQGPKGNSESVAMHLVKKYAINIFLKDTAYSVLLSILLLIFNFLYQWIFNAINIKKHLTVLFLASLTILIFISWLSAEWYYSNISGEVRSYFEYYNHRS
jgi:hypothetical protein